MSELEYDRQNKLEFVHRGMHTGADSLNIETKRSCAWPMKNRSTNIAKACVEVSGKNRGWQNKSSSVRRIVEEQLEIRKGRGTTDGMFALR